MWSLGDCDVVRECQAGKWPEEAPLGLSVDSRLGRGQERSQRKHQSCRCGPDRISEHGKAETDSEDLWQFSTVVLGKKMDLSWVWMRL